MKNPEEILKYSGVISDNIDQHKDTFGFVPKAAYKSSISSGKLWVAVKDDQYIGHLMFGGKIPYAVRVFQIFVLEEHRKKKVGAALIDELKKHAEELSCLSLEAHIAEDLTLSRKFYEKHGFVKACVRKKENTTDRKVIIYTCKVNTPSLLVDEPFSIDAAIKQAPDIGLIDTYIIDLNILYELINDRAHSDTVKKLFKAALSADLKIKITPEFLVELKRTKESSKEDHILKVAETLPHLRKVSDKELTSIEENLRSIIFPKRSRKRAAAANDSSDLRHIAYCIYYSIPRFITLENQLLKHRDVIYEQYNIQVCSPSDLGLDYGTEDIEDISSKSELIFSHDVSITRNPSKKEIDNFLEKSSDFDDQILNSLKSYPHENHVEMSLAQDADNPVALLHVQKQLGPNSLTGHILISDASEKHEHIIEHFLETFSRIIQRLKPNSVRLFTTNNRYLNELCPKKGYRLDLKYSGVQNSYTKLSAPLVISDSNWSFFKSYFEQNTSVKLPDLIPAMNGIPTEEVHIDLQEGKTYRSVGLTKLENLLSPSMFLLKDREGLILPIKTGYADGLLSRPKDYLPFPISNEAFLKLEKAFFRSCKNFTSLAVAGMPVVFYESKGKKGLGRGAIGCARITLSSIVTVEEALRNHGKQGVFDKHDLANIANQDGKLHVITFDNFQEFENPVPYEDLREMGCGNAAFVSPELLPATTLKKIIYKGHNLPMQDTLISIKPEYVAKILSKRKTIELRRKPLPYDENSKMWIYSTAPDKCVKAVAKPVKTHVGTPSEIWEKFGEDACIKKEDFEKYYADTDTAYAIELADVTEIPEHIKLSQIKKWVPDFNAPQFFRYIRHESDMYTRFSQRLYAS